MGLTSGSLSFFLSALTLHFRFLSCHWASEKGRLGTRTPKPMTFGRLVTPWTALRRHLALSLSPLSLLIPLPFACGTCASLSSDFSWILSLTFSSRVQVHSAPGLTFHLSFRQVTSHSWHTHTYKYIFKLTLTAPRNSHPFTQGETDTSTSTSTSYDIHPRHRISDSLKPTSDVLISYSTVCLPKTSWLFSSSLLPLLCIFFKRNHASWYTCKSVVTCHVHRALHAPVVPQLHLPVCWKS